MHPVNRKRLLVLSAAAVGAVAIVLFTTFPPATPGAPPGGCPGFCGAPPFTLGAPASARVGDLEWINLSIAAIPSGVVLGLTGVELDQSGTRTADPFISNVTLSVYSSGIAFLGTYSFEPSHWTLNGSPDLRTGDILVFESRGVPGVVDSESDLTLSAQGTFDGSTTVTVP